MGIDRDRALRDHLLYLLGDAGAHVDFDQAVEGFPAALRGVRPPGSPHSAWELVEHLRIAQRDILEFSREPGHISPEWPRAYWPAAPEPPDPGAWAGSVAAFRTGLKAMMDLVADPATELYARIPHGDGQTILREALLVADHNSYHVGQLMLVRRQLEAQSPVRE